MVGSMEPDWMIKKSKLRPGMSETERVVMVVMVMREKRVSQ